MFQASANLSEQCFEMVLKRVSEQRCNVTSKGLIREQYENKTMPADCIGRKGVGGDYFPTEQCIADIVEHVRSGVLTTHHCMHDMWCFCQHDVLLPVMNCVAYVICAEGEVGQHFRDFISGAAGDQDLEGFDDLDFAQDARAGEAEEEQQDQDLVDSPVPAADELRASGEGEALLPPWRTLQKYFLVLHD